jgi:hypothetical protein
MARAPRIKLENLSTSGSKRVENAHAVRNANVSAGAGRSKWLLVKDVPFALTALIALLVWFANRSIETVEDSPTVEYVQKIKKRPSTDDIYDVTFQITNLSLKHLFKAVSFYVAVPTGLLSDPHSFPVAPSKDAQSDNLAPQLQPRKEGGKDVPRTCRFYVSQFQPNASWIFKVAVRDGDSPEPRLSFDFSPNPSNADSRPEPEAIRLKAADLETFLVKHKVKILFFSTSLAFLILLAYLLYAVFTLRRLPRSAVMIFVIGFTSGLANPHYALGQAQSESPQQFKIVDHYGNPVACWVWRLMPRAEKPERLCHTTEEQPMVVIKDGCETGCRLYLYPDYASVYHADYVDCPYSKSIFELKPIEDAVTRKMAETVGLFDDSNPSGAAKMSFAFGEIADRTKDKSSRDAYTLKSYVEAAKFLGTDKILIFDARLRKPITSSDFERAIEDYQKANNLKETRQLDYKTLQKAAGLNTSDLIRN